MAEAKRTSDAAKGAAAAFQWEDPFLLEAQLKEEERRHCHVEE